MSDALRINERSVVNVNRARPIIDQFMPQGTFHIEHIRDGKVIRAFDQKNLIMTEGKNFLLDIGFHATTKCSTWYLSLIDNAGYGGTGVAVTDTYDNINGVGNDWDEFEDYEYAADGTKRVPYNEAAAGGASITNAANVGVFDIVAAGGTIKGIFLCGEADAAGAAPDTQGDHHADGVLWCATLFSTGDVVVINGDQLKITYTLSC